MKSFRIPMARMQLSEDALETALEITTVRDAGEFIDAFGSHVSNGRQEVRTCSCFWIIRSTEYICMCRCTAPSPGKECESTSKQDPMKSHRRRAAGVLITQMRGKDPSNAGTAGGEMGW